MSIGKVPKTKTEVRKFYEGAAGKQGGTPNGAGVKIKSSDVGYTRTVLELTNTPVVLADNAGVIAFGSLKLFDFPEGNIDIAGATCNLVVKKSSAGVLDAWDGDFGIGTAAAGNNNALAGTEQNIIPTTPTPQAAAVGGVQQTTAKGASTASIQLDGTGGAVDVFLNMLVDDTDHDVTTTPANLLVTGTVTITWANLGDK